jgi:hypothetical protein
MAAGRSVQEAAIVVAGPAVAAKDGQPSETRQLRSINSLPTKTLQYTQHVHWRFIMGTFKEVVCGSLIVITFAAILYSVPI